MEAWVAIELRDRVCVITGAGQGIGAGIVRGFAARGAKVVATDLQPPTLPEAAMSLAWDVTQPERAGAVMKDVVEKFGRVDAFVANAGIYPRNAVDQMTPDDWRKVMAINLDGAFYGAQAAAAVMRQQRYGKIVLVSSIQVELGVPQQSHYVAAKAGIIGLARSLSRALGPDGIRVNVVMPGAVHTESEDRLFDPGVVAKWVAEHQAINQRIEPEDIEPSFAFLCSSESDAITGQVLCVDLGVVGY